MKCLEAAKQEFVTWKKSCQLTLQQRPRRQDSLGAETGGEGPHPLGCLAMHTFRFLFKPGCQVRNFENRFG